MQGEGSSSCSLSELQAYSFAAGEGDSHCDIVVGGCLGCLLVKPKQSSVRWALQSCICIITYVNIYGEIVHNCSGYRQLVPVHLPELSPKNFRDVAHLLLMYQKVHSQHLAA